MSKDQSDRYREPNMLLIDVLAVELIRTGQFPGKPGSTYNDTPSHAYHVARGMMDARRQILDPDCEAPTADLEDEAGELIDRGSEPELPKRSYYPLGSEFTDSETSTLLKVVVPKCICNGCFYEGKGRPCKTYNRPVCGSAARNGGQGVIFVPVEPEVKDAPAAVEAFPTEPQQPAIGQRFYVKDGTLLETVKDDKARCNGCYYATRWVDGRCPWQSMCSPDFRDDKTSVYFLPVDTTPTSE